VRENLLASHSCVCVCVCDVNVMNVASGFKLFNFSCVFCDRCKLTSDGRTSNGGWRLNCFQTLLPTLAAAEWFGCSVASVCVCVCVCVVSVR